MMDNSVAAVLDLALKSRDKDAVLKEVKDVFEKHGFTVEITSKGVEDAVGMTSGSDATTTTTTTTNSTRTTMTTTDEQQQIMRPPLSLRQTAAATTSSSRTTTKSNNNSSNSTLARAAGSSSSSNDNNNSNSNTSVSAQELEDAARIILDLNDVDVDLGYFQDSPTTTLTTTVPSSSSSSRNNSNTDIISHRSRSKRRRRAGQEQRLLQLPEYEDINTQYTQEEVSSQVALCSGGSLRNTWKHGGKLISELGLLCSREPEDRLKLLNNVQCCLVFLEANNQSLLEYGGNSTLINAQHLQQKQHSDILNIAKTSKGNLDDLNEASIAIAMMRVVQSINIVYCRHIYHTIKKGKKRVFDQGVFQFKEEKVARKLMSQLKQGARRYMHLIRIFGADIVLLPLTFNPWNLEQMSEDSFLRALDSIDVEDVKKKLVRYRTLDRPVPTVINKIVQMANNDQHVFEGNARRQQVQIETNRESIQESSSVAEDMVLDG